jgi:hypothetical protein
MGSSGKVSSEQSGQPGQTTGPASGVAQQGNSLPAAGAPSGSASNAAASTTTPAVPRKTFVSVNTTQFFEPYFPTKEQAEEAFIKLLKSKV